MANLFFQLGRTVGHAAIPALRKSKSAWKALTGTEAESIQAEGEFGAALAKELRLKTGVHRDTEDAALVQRVAQQLAKFVRNKERVFRAEVLVEPGLSAMALPGGFIFVSEGLVRFCENRPDELAFVIGHEMGHVVRGHALERVLLRIGSEGLSAILSRGLLTPLLRDAGIQWLQSGHAQEAEREADEFAVRIARAAGYRAAAAVAFLERIGSARGQGDDTGDYLRSHPVESERLATVAGVLR